MDKSNFNNMRMAQGNKDIFLAIEQNKVDAYNQSQGEDDKTDMQCKVCNNRGRIAFLSGEGKFCVRPCKCSGKIGRAHV